ncbi:zinc finger protein 586-like [Adelges cooleyi]|uniref:zinc finger protein 586-like n=1 Tax=Adelges cooleyi TaxID=133065 RepID=UPI00217F5AD8|nr:zinc finger protein 586-like [Adelges cooleyi]
MNVESQINQLKYRSSFKFMCPNSNCGKSYKYKPDLNRHIKDYCDKRWVCMNDCGRKYLNKKSLIRHLRYECGVRRQFQCNTCLQQFKLQNHLKKHLQRCTSRTIAIDQHISTVNGVVRDETEMQALEHTHNRYYCINGCGKSYKNKQHMTRHARSECGCQAKFRCQYCMKSFTRKQSLKLHIVVVHNRLPDAVHRNPRQQLNWSDNQLT